MRACVLEPHTCSLDELGCCHCGPDLITSKHVYCNYTPTHLHNTESSSQRLSKHCFFSTETVSTCSNRHVWRTSPMTSPYYPLCAFSSDCARAPVTFTVAAFCPLVKDKQYSRVQSAQYVLAIMIMFLCSPDG